MCQGRREVLTRKERIHRVLAQEEGFLKGLTASYKLILIAFEVITPEDVERAGDRNTAVARLVGASLTEVQGALSAGEQIGLVRLQPLKRAGTVLTSVIDERVPAGSLIRQAHHGDDDQPLLVLGGYTGRRGHRRLAALSHEAMRAIRKDPTEPIRVTHINAIDVRVPEDVIALPSGLTLNPLPWHQIPPDLVWHGRDGRRVVVLSDEQERGEKTLTPALKYRNLDSGRSSWRRCTEFWKFFRPTGVRIEDTEKGLIGNIIKNIGLK